jgi:hypothetical protein
MAHLRSPTSLKAITICDRGSINGHRYAPANRHIAAKSFRLNPDDASGYVIAVQTS